jgi:AcrR family transcriptional regulator
MTEQTLNSLLDAALKLFNADGTARVSTNHIARAARISPGNLYYHFRNKAEIVRALLDRMIADADRAWAAAASGRGGAVELREVIGGTLEIVWAYRFFYRELAALVQNDPILRRRYSAIRRQRLKQIEELVRSFNAAGAMRGPEGPALDALVKISWMVGEFALASAELDGATGKRAPIDQAIAMLFALWRPYLTEQGTELIR